MNINNVIITRGGKSIGNIYQGGGKEDSFNASVSQNLKREFDAAFSNGGKQEEFDVALSYASEQERFVSRVDKILTGEGLRVFFAPDCENEYKAKDMFKKFYEIYRYRSHYVVCFVSKEYLEKDYTMHEYECAFLKNKDKGENRIIVVNFDESVLPHLDPDINYIDATKSREVQVADSILRIVK